VDIYLIPKILLQQSHIRTGVEVTSDALKRLRSCRTVVPGVRFRQYTVDNHCQTLLTYGSRFGIQSQFLFAFFPSHNTACFEHQCWLCSGVRREARLTGGWAGKSSTSRGQADISSIYLESRTLTASAGPEQPFGNTFMDGGCYLLGLDVSCPLSTWWDD
jgi:hypothetical protein